MVEKQNITYHVNGMVRMGMVGIGLLLSSCSYLKSDEEIVFSPRFTYQQREYSCSGVKSPQKEYERISVFRRDTHEIVPTIHYLKHQDINQITVVDSDLNRQEAFDLLDLCQEELKKQPYVINIQK